VESEDDNDDSDNHDDIYMDTVVSAVLLFHLLTSYVVNVLMY
jgi:hypothetical protein